MVPKRFESNICLDCMTNSSFVKLHSENNLIKDILSETISSRLYRIKIYIVELEKNCRRNLIFQSEFILGCVHKNDAKNILLIRKLKEYSNYLRQCMYTSVKGKSCKDF